MWRSTLILLIILGISSKRIAFRRNSLQGHSISALPMMNPSEEEAVQRLVDRRIELRHLRKYDEADILLDELRKRDVLVVDNSFKSEVDPGGSTWSFARKWSSEEDCSIKKMVEEVDKTSHEDLSLLAKRIRENSELTFAKDLELSGRSFSDAAFTLSLRGVEDTEVYNELVIGAKKELERCAHRASFRLIDIMLMAEKFAAAGVTDDSFYALAAEKMRSKEATADDDSNEDIRSTMIEKLETGHYNLLEDRPLLTLFRHAARQAKAGLQAVDSPSPPSVNSKFSRHVNSLFEDPTLPLVVDLGCGYGVSMIGIAHQEGNDAVKYRYNCLGVDMSQEAIDYAQGVSTRWGMAKHCQFVVADALSSLKWVESYEGPVEYILCQFPTPFALLTEDQANEGEEEERGDKDSGNAQLPDMDTFIISQEIVDEAGQVLSKKQGKGFVVQSQVEDVMVTVKAMVEAVGNVHDGRKLRVPTSPGEMLDAVPWPVETGEEGSADPATEWLSLDTLLERSTIQAQREGSRLRKYLSSSGASGGLCERAFGAGYLRENPLGKGGRTETEVMCIFEDKPVHRVAFRMS